MQINASLSNLAQKEVDMLKPALSKTQMPYSIQDKDDDHDHDSDEEPDELAEPNKDEDKVSYTLQFDDPSKMKNENIISRQISYPELLFCMRKVIGDPNLLKLVKKHGVGVHLSETAQLIGDEESVDEVINTIIGTPYQKSSSMTYNQAKILKRTSFVRYLCDIYKIQLSIIYDRGLDAYCLLIKGKDVSSVQKFAQHIEQMKENCMVIFENQKSKNFSDESDVILEYLKTLCHNIWTGENKGDLEIGKFENKSTGSWVFYLFANYPEVHFKKFQDFVQSELKGLSILRLFPDINRKVCLDPKTDLKKLKLYLNQLNDGSYLVMGYPSDFISELEYIVGKGDEESTINFSRLQVRRSSETKDKSFGDLECLMVEQLDDTQYFHTFIIQANWQVVYHLLVNVKAMLNPNNNEQISSIIRREEESFRNRLILKEKDDPIEEVKYEQENMRMVRKPDIEFQDQRDLKNPSPLIKETSEGSISDIDLPELKDIDHFPQDNLTGAFFSLESDDNESIATIDESDPVHNQLCQLVKRGYPQAKIQEIVRVCDPEHWKKYVESVDKIGFDQVKEYIVFSEDTDDPTEQIKIKDPKEMAHHFLATFNPMMNKCNTDEGEFCLLACVALYAKSSVEIKDYCPAYLISFT